jgi:hypothetical protein
MTRWKASSIHLALSAIIASAVLALMLLVWYPYPLFAAVGGQQVLMILLGVDVVLGPLITLLIFNTRKSRRELTLDLSVIAALQTAALIYGMSIVFQARPVYVVFSGNSFDLVTAHMLSDADIAKAKYPEYRSLPLTGPVYVYSEMPADINERNEVVLGSFLGKDLPEYPQYYRPFDDHLPAAAMAAKPLSQLKESNPDRAAEIDEMLRDSGHLEADVGYLPLRAKHKHLAVVIEKNNGRILKILTMNPWPDSRQPETQK